MREGPCITWSLSGRSKRPCICPVFVRQIKCPAKSEVFDERKSAQPVALINVYGRCRQCANCREHTRRQWIQRTRVEAGKCPGRLWFVTLTSNAHHFGYVEMQARSFAHSARKDWGSLSPDGKYDFRARAFKREVSLYLKRLRKGVGKKYPARLRFFCVIEPTPALRKDGTPNERPFSAHAHLIVFEQAEGCVTERLIRARWRGRGFASGTLIKRAEEPTAYVSKYLGKDRLGRPHASLNFGEP